MICLLVVEHQARALEFVVVTTGAVTFICLGTMFLLAQMYQIAEADVCRKRNKLAKFSSYTATDSIFSNRFLTKTATTKKAREI